ncbi:hypothetical protein [Catenulispora subtropica]|uniref:PknH-like extracellular domain-containing protein n=1 Tax=Catenulispora subtropica TaxID=450798 RepID=A0ABP5CN49_9ACTN
MNRRTTLAKTAAYLAAAGAITTSLTACGSNHQTDPGASRAAAQNPATGGAPDPTATGSALKSLLPAGSDLASGVTVTDAADSGSDWTTPDALAAPRLAGADCAALPQITADEASGDYRASHAKETITVHNTPIAQLVLAGTNHGDAQRQIDEVKALADRCRTFSAPNSDGTSVGGTVTATALPGLGDEALDVRVTATGPNAAAYQQPELILVRVGDKLAVVSDNYPSQDNGSALKAAEVLAARLTGQPV